MANVVARKRSDKSLLSQFRTSLDSRERLSIALGLKGSSALSKDEQILTLRDALARKLQVEEREIVRDSLRGANLGFHGTGRHVRSSDAASSACSVASLSLSARGAAETHHLVGDKAAKWHPDAPGGPSSPPVRTPSDRLSSAPSRPASSVASGRAAGRPPAAPASPALSNRARHTSATAEPPPPPPPPAEVAAATSARHFLRLPLGAQLDPELTRHFRPVTVTARGRPGAGGPVGVLWIPRAKPAGADAQAQTARERGGAEASGASARRPMTSRI